MVVGVLGIQGGFSKHKEMIDSMGYKTAIVRTPDELKKINALIIPGGESTTFLNLFDKLDLEDAIKEYSINSIQAIVKRIRKKLPKGLISTNYNRGYTLNINV